MIEQDYSLGALSAVTGGSPNTLQLWAREGLLRPNEETTGAGRGVHRLFSRQEAEVAAVLVHAAKYGGGLKTLRVFAKRLRGYAFDRKTARKPYRSLIDAARAGDASVFAALLRTEDRADIEFFRITDLSAGIPTWLATTEDALLVNLWKAWHPLDAAG